MGAEDSAIFIIHKKIFITNDETGLNVYSDCLVPDANVKLYLIRAYAPFCESKKFICKNIRRKRKTIKRKKENQAKRTTFFFEKTTNIYGATNKILLNIMSKRKYDLIIKANGSGM